MIYKTWYESPLGKILLASDGENIVGLWIEGQKYFFKGLGEHIVIKDDLEIFVKTKKWLDMYFSKEKPPIKDLKLAPKGSDFRQNVWKILCEIPYGKTITYGDIANKIAKIMNKDKMSAQAVGNAVGHNPISIIIPCHRVVGKAGNLTGYAGGIDKKIELLKLEGIDMKQFFIPKKGTAL